MSKETVKTQIDLDITNKTTYKSISPLNVGSNMKAVVDLIPPDLIKTNGVVLAVIDSKATLQYDINTVNKDGGSEVKLPTTTEVGKEVLFLASNYAGTVSVYVNDAEDVKLSGGINGISGNQGNLQINANEAYRFIYRENGYWYFEKIINIPNNYYQLISERTTDGTLASNSDLKYPTEKAVKTYVDSKDSRPYKVYTALLTQIGTNAPVATILENTLSGTPVWSYNAVGDYQVTLVGQFIINKTTATINNGYDASTGNNGNFATFISSADVIIVANSLNNTSSDDMLGAGANSIIEICY